MKDVGPIWQIREGGLVYELIVKQNFLLNILLKQIRLYTNFKLDDKFEKMNNILMYNK